MDYDKRDDSASLDELIEEIIVDAYGDDEQLWAFRQALEDNITLPCDGLVIGEPVSVIDFDYDGNERRGLTARCRGSDGLKHVVAAADVVLLQRSEGACFLAAYRKWLGLKPYSQEVPVDAHRRRRQHKASAPTDLDLSAPIELAALSIKEKSARCRLLGGDRIITLRASMIWKAVPGEIILIRPRKQWSYAGHSYLSGEIESTRLDVPALGLVPLRLTQQGIWKPEEYYWGDSQGARFLIDAVHAKATWEEYEEKE
ncbi:MAG: hypothetical protein HY644_08610 [Acidobacteria bacterium]|nr:hypothetical protein [Acidobacteriota bacterium]